MTDPKQLVTMLTHIFENNADIVAFVLVGSQARQDVYKATAYSDLEAYIVAYDEKAEAVEKELPAILQMTGEILFSFRHAIGFVAVYDDLFRIELPVVKISDMQNVFNRPKAQMTKILLDKTGGKLDEILTKRPETIDYASDFSERVTNFWYWQVVAVQYFLKGEFYNARAVLNIHASSLIKLFEHVNNQTILLLETNKRVETFLTQEQLSTLKLVTPKYNKDEIGQSLYEVMEIFPTVFQKIKAMYNYSYDATLEGKMKPRLLNILKENENRESIT